MVDGGSDPSCKQEIQGIDVTAGQPGMLEVHPATGGDLCHPQLVLQRPPSGQSLPLSHPREFRAAILTILRCF